eukprot:gene25225-31656_t
MPIIDMIEARSSGYHSMEFCTCVGECSCGGSEKTGSHCKILQPYVLRVVNKIIEGSTRAQEQLSLVGIIPTIMTIFDRSHSHAHMKGVKVASSVDPVTLEAARFIHQISSTSSLTLQMLIGAGTPHYNLAILEDMSILLHHRIILKTILPHDCIREALSLLKEVLCLLIVG